MALFEDSVASPSTTKKEKPLCETTLACTCIRIMVVACRAASACANAGWGRCNGAINSSEEELDTAMSEMDRDGSGEVDFNEFWEW